MSKSGKMISILVKGILHFTVKNLVKRIFLSPFLTRCLSINMWK